MLIIQAHKQGFNSSMTVKINTLLKLALVLLIYKNILCFVIPIGILQLIPTMIIGFLFLIMVGSGAWLKMDTLKSIVVTMLILFMILTVKSILFPSGPVPLRYVLLSFSQLAIPFMILFIIVMSRNDLWDLFIFTLKISTPVILFGVIEPVLPDQIITWLYSIHTLQKYGYASSTLSASYEFKDFGIDTMRTGSLFFEPLTLSLFTAILIIGTVNKKKFGIQRLLLYLCNFFSIGKVGLLLLISSHTFKVARRASLLFVGVAIIIVVWFGIKMSSLSQMQLVAMLSSGGNHIFGMINGFVNATVYPIGGHGLGTSSYVVFRAAVSDGNLEVFRDPKNKIPANGYEYMAAGGESAFGVIVYQLGFLFFAVFLLFYLYCIYRFYKGKDYWMVGFVVGYLVCNAMSESVMALLIFALSNILIVAKLRALEDIETIVTTDLKKETIKVPVVVCTSPITS